jgi:hypothetical protein
MLDLEARLRRLTQRRQVDGTQMAKETKETGPFAVLRDGNLRQAAQRVATAGGVGSDGVKDTELIHVSKRELPIVDAVLKALGGAGTRNQSTGVRQYVERADRDQQSNRTADRAQSAVGGGRNAAGGSRNVDLTDQDILSKDGWGDGTDPNGPTITRDSQGGTSPGGGTFTSWDYSPGAVPNVPDASPGQLAGLFSSAVPVVGGLNNAASALEGLFSGNFSSVSNGGPIGQAVDGAFGTTPGKQRGWAPERSRGVANGVGGATGERTMSSNSPLRALQLISDQDPDAYAALLASLQSPKVFRSDDAVIVR